MLKMFFSCLGKYLKKFLVLMTKTSRIAMMLKLGNNFIGGKVKLIKIKKDKSQLK